MASPAASRPSPEASWRYERKFEAHGLPLPEVEHALRLHPACFRTAYPSRQVNNLYFDSPDLRWFATHVNGAPTRFKLRIRWYGAARGLVPAPVLELKLRRGMVGSKARFALPPLEYGPDLDVAALRRETLRRVPDREVAEALAGAEPVLLNRYHRRYLLSADRRFRMTVDSALRFETAGARPIGALSLFEERGAVVLELKYGVGDDGGAARVAGALPFRLGKYSKYVQGVLRLGAGA
jgi:hypothetical protein